MSQSLAQKKPAQRECEIIEAKVKIGGSSTVKDAVLATLSQCLDQGWENFTLVYDLGDGGGEVLLSRSDIWLFIVKKKSKQESE